MFANLKVAQLRKLVSTYRKYHNIKGYSKMKKAELISELDKRFVVKDGMLYLKQQEPTPAKKRITPTLVSSSSGSSSSSLPSFPSSSSSSTRTKGQQRYDSAVKRAEDHYKNYQYDTSPDLAF